MLMPLGMSILFQVAPPSQRGTIMGVFGLPILIAPIIGPTLGGYLVEYVDWRPIFTLNVPDRRAGRAGRDADPARDARAARARASTGRASCSRRSAFSTAMLALEQAPARRLVAPARRDRCC